MIKVKKTRLFSSEATQRGVVLVVSLVFLIALTAVAAALMQNSTIDMKMAGASEEKSVAQQEALSAVDQIIFNQVDPNQVNLFARPVKGDNFPLGEAALFTTIPEDTVAVVDVINNTYELDVHCPHFKVASSVNIFSCSVLRAQVTKRYGRKNNSQIVVNSGIAQQLLNQ